MDTKITYYKTFAKRGEQTHAPSYHTRDEPDVELRIIYLYLSNGEMYEISVQLEQYIDIDEDEIVKLTKMLDEQLK